MKRYFSFALLLALLLSVFSLGYAATVQIGDGTATSGNHPISGMFGYSYTQQIFTQEQIGRSGPITKIRFYHKSGSIDNSKDWTIWMGHTQKTEFTSDTDWEAPVNLTQVFDGDVSALMPAEVENWMEITLDAPFNYNNSDNLLIAVHEYTPGSGTLSWGAFVSGADTGIYYRSDSANPDPMAPPEAYQRTNRINRIQLVYPDTVPPLAPILISPANGGYTIDGEVLCWEFNLAGDDATGYDVYFGTTVDPPLVVSNQVGTTYQPTLQASTRYYWKVVAKNAFGSSPASEVWTFRTPGPNNLVESFEGAQFPPLGWSGTWTQHTSYPYHGSASARGRGSTSTQHVLSTPLLTIEDDSSFSFWLRGTNSSGIIEVVHSQDGESWTQIGDNITIPMTGVYYNHNIDLSSLSGGNYYLALRTGLVTGTYYADLFIGPTITPLPPDVPVLTGPADGAANISNFPTFTWDTPGTGGVATSFNIYCDANPNPTTLIGTSTGLSYIATTGLPFNTTLYWTVKAVNDMGESAPATPRSFTTMADNTIYDLSWVEDFTAETFPPTEWGRYRGLYPTEPLEANTSRWERGDFAYIADPANPAARCRIWGTSTKHWLVTPPISIPAGAHQVEFDLALTAWGSSDPITPGEQADDRFIVLIAENPTMIGATILREWNNTGSPYVYDEIATLGEAQVISLDGHTGVRFIGFYGESTESGGDGALFVDNVQVTEAPGPEAPILVSPADGAVNVSKYGIDLTWEPDPAGATPDYYAVYLATTQDDIYNERRWETTNTSFNPVLEDATFSFAYEQRYYWTVGAIFGGDEVVNEPPHFFDIEADPTVSTFPWIENFDALGFGEMPVSWTTVDSEAGGWFAASSATIGAHTQPMFAVVPYNATLPKNEWMITPPISMQEGLTYNISFAVKGEGWDEVPENLALYWGTTPYVASLTANPALFDNNGTSYVDWTLENVSFTPPSTGLYFFGWHAYSPANLDYIAVDTITISQGFDVDLAIVGTGGQTIGNVGEPVVRTVAVRNMGTTAQSNYTVYLKEAVTNNVLAQELITETIDAGETVVHTLSWTPAAAGVVNLYAEVALAGDQELANNVSDPVEVTIYPANMELLFVGDPATNQGIHLFPFTVAYGDLVAETVYLASEMQATDGVIHQVAYYSYFAHDMTLSHNVQIWMKNTDTVNLEAGWLPWDGYQLVYDGPVEFTTGMHEIIIPLTTPFNYTGGNLAIRTSKTYDAAADPNTYNLWLLDTRGHYGYRTRVEVSNDGEMDHTNPTGTAVTYLYPNITFFMSTTNLVETVDAPVVTVTIAEPNALLDWELIPYAYGYNVYLAADPYNFGPDPAGTVYGAGAQINNITDAEKLFVKVTGVTYRDFGRAQGLLRNLEPREIRLVDENLIGKAKQDLQVLTP